MSLEHRGLKCPGFSEPPRGCALTPQVNPLFLCIVVLVRVKNPAALSQSRILGGSWLGLGRHCGNRSGQAHSARTVELQFRCSTIERNSQFLRKRSGGCFRGNERTDLTLKINGRRTCEEAFIVRLLHGRGRIGTHHEAQDA